MRRCSLITTLPHACPQNLHPFIGSKSMLVAGGERWAQQRRAFNPAFAYAFLKRLVPTFVDRTHTLVSTTPLQDARVHVGNVLMVIVLHIVVRTACRAHVTATEWTRKVKVQLHAPTVIPCMHACAGGAHRRPHQHR